MSESAPEGMFEDSGAAVLRRGDGEADLHIPDIGHIHLIGEMLDETQTNLRDERLMYRGANDAGLVFTVFLKEDLGKVVVDEVIEGDLVIYKRPTYH